MHISVWLGSDSDRVTLSFLLAIEDKAINVDVIPKKRSPTGVSG